MSAGSDETAPDRSTVQAAERMNKDELLRLAERLRTEDPISTADREFLAGTLERMAAKAPSRPGRPKASPAERAFQRVTRRSMANDIYEGTLPEWVYPPALALAVEQAKGKRTEADAVTAAILGKGHSVSSIQKARTIRTMNREVWEEFKALLILSASPRK